MKAVRPVAKALFALVALSCAKEADLPGTRIESGHAEAGAPEAPAEKSTSSDILAQGSSLSSADLQLIYRAPLDMFCEGRGLSCPGVPVDLDFNPARPGEMWVVFRQPYQGEACDFLPKGQTAGPQQAGCSLMRSKVAIFQDGTSADPVVELKEDGNSWHFMRLATGLAFAEDDTFATTGEAYTGNYTDTAPEFMGPTWWSADPEIFAQEFTTTDADGEEMRLNGSHLDMLHGTPYAMGIAHQTAHVFWCFNGLRGSVDRYDFKDAHRPGGSDHSDGSYHRFAAGELLRLPGTPSHMAFGTDGTTLYLADTGHGRVIALDTESGELGQTAVVADDQIAEPLEVDGADIREIVKAGVMEAPSGLAVDGSSLLVSDSATGFIHRVGFEGDPIAVFDTGLGAGALAGITLGPDGRLYLVDQLTASIYRVGQEP